MHSLRWLHHLAACCVFLIIAGCGGGSSKVAPPVGLTYAIGTAVYTTGIPITPNNPSVGGGAVTSYVVVPAMPAGLLLNAATGVISGTPTAIAASTSYTVTASNAGGGTTARLSITVNPPAPLIQSQPASQTVEAGQPAIFSVTAAGSGTLQYQWKRDGVSIPDATSGSFSLPAPVLTDSGAQFSVVVNDAYGGTVTSASATLTVVVQRPSALTYTAMSVAYTTGLAIAPNSPSHAGGTVDAYGVTPALPAGLLLNTSTGVISGTPTAIAAAASYTVSASNASGTATAALSITVNPPAPTIGAQPAGQSVEVGQTATFSVSATGTGTLGYQWEKNGTFIPDAISAILTLPPTLQADNGAVISVVVSDSYGGTVTSATATLTVLPLPVGRVVLNELCAANASVLISNSKNTNYTNYTEWVEIANTGSGDVDLAGYCLTNDLAVPDKWAIPAATVVKAGEAVIFWADGVGLTTHMNFKLKQTGGTLALFSPTRDLINSVVYPAQVTDTSYGVMPGGGTPVWRFQATPTPRTINSGVMVTSSIRAVAPTFSVLPGFYSEAITVTISADSSATIRYTTDGSIPTLDSTLYTAPVALSATAVVKARAFTTSSLPSLVTVGTYFIGETSTLPVVSVSTDPKNLWDNDIGIYVMGSAASSTAPYFGANFWNDWERPTHVELFAKDGTRGFCYFGALKINGNTTVGVPEKSLSFGAKVKYDGLTTFTYPLFPDKPTVTSYPRFLVRNSGQDWPRTLFRDGLTAWMIKDQMKVDAADTGLDYQGYRPVLHFLNGQYHGVINLREKADAYFAVSNWGATAGKVDFLEYDGATLLTDDGSATTYTDLIDYLKANDITLPATYAEVKTRMDVEEFMNYAIVETFCGNYDWPASNTKLWRSQAAGSKWRWLLQDTDFAWGYESEFWTVLDASLDMFHYLLDPVGNPWPNPPEGTFLFRTLIQNAEFRARFLAKYQQHLDTTFQPTRILGIIDSIQATLEPEMQRQIDKWGGQICGLVGSDYKYPTSKAEWLDHVAQVRNYVVNRPAYVRVHLATHFPGGGLVP